MKREADEIKNKELEIIGRRVREARIAKGLTQDLVLLLIKLKWV